MGSVFNCVCMVGRRHVRVRPTIQTHVRVQPTSTSMQFSHRCRYISSIRNGRVNPLRSLLAPSRATGERRVAGDWRGAAHGRMGEVVAVRSWIAASNSWGRDAPALSQPRPGNTSVMRQAYHGRRGKDGASAACNPGKVPLPSMSRPM